jgi:hypothetical protein
MRREIHAPQLALPEWNHSSQSPLLVSLRVPGWMRKEGGQFQWIASRSKFEVTNFKKQMIDKGMDIPGPFHPKTTGFRSGYRMEYVGFALLLGTMQLRSYLLFLLSCLLLFEDFRGEDLAKIRQMF